MSDIFANTEEAMDFWSKHFCWNQLKESYPEIKGRMLDFGCGAGHSDICLLKSGHIQSVVGVDTNEHRIGTAQSFKVPNAEFFCMDICKEDVGKLGMFDSAWSAHVFEHIEDPTCVFENIKKVMKPGSHMLIEVPFANNYDTPEHVHKWHTLESFTDFFSAHHLNIVRTEHRESNGVLRMLIKF